MGRVAVRAAAGLPGVRELVVADRDLDAARRLVRELADSRVRTSACRVDVTDEAELEAALQEADIVFNAIGPYHRYGAVALRAAIRTRTHYINVCDDGESTLRMLDLDADARAAGVCAVVGMGANPGISNLLAAKAVARFDIVIDLYTAWPVDVLPASGAEETGLRGPDGRPMAAVVHWMRQLGDTVAVVHDGALVQRLPLRPVTLTLPGGRKGTAYTVGHPEPGTLRRSYRPVKDSANLMVLPPGTAAYLDVLRSDIASGRLTDETAAADLAKPAMRRAVRAAVRSLRFKGPGSLPLCFATATGVKNGRLATVLAHLTGTDALMNDMAGAAGIPVALGLAQLLDGTVARPGVRPPETAIEPDRFFADLAERFKPVAVVIEQVP